MAKHLTSTQVSQYKEIGFVSPINIFTKEEVASCINEIEAFEAETGKQIDFPFSHVHIRFFPGLII